LVLIEPTRFRLDGAARPASADIPAAGYAAPALLPGIVTFPATGGWRVSATLGEDRRSFIVRVTKLATTRS
jgi:hypothetical protein